ncbi:hypothetical protein JTB14_025463 [Gonioctena quinquepunctata]|nr:hypothetical protein JTB14_025463 [Gonioctena quinquepunctata]
MLLMKHGLDVLGITETWLNENMSDAAVKIDNYNFIILDRGNNRRGGVLVSTSGQHLRQVIDIANNNYLIGTVYRPPGGQVLDAINSLEHSIASMFPDTDNIILMGDLNLNLMQVTPATDLLTDLLDLFNITQIIKAPTLLLKKGDNDLIDGEAQHVDMHQVTDHQLVFCQLKIKIPQNKIKYIIYRDFSAFNQVDFEMELQMQNWQEIFFTEDIDMKVDILTNNIKSVFDRHAPLRKVRSTKPRAPCMTNNLKIMKKQRNKLLAKYKSTKNLDDWEAYKRARNDFTAAVRTEKQNYLNEIHRTKKNRKDTWKALEQLNIHSKKSDISVPPDLNDAEAINCHFINSVNALECQVDDDLVQYYNTHKVNYNLDHCKIEPFREHDVLEAVDSIKSNTEGSDGITLHMIKMCCPFYCHLSLTYSIAAYLRDIFL